MFPLCLLIFLLLFVVITSYACVVIKQVQTRAVDVYTVAQNSSCRYSLFDHLRSDSWEAYMEELVRLLTYQEIVDILSLTQAPCVELPCAVSGVAAEESVYLHFEKCKALEEGYRAKKLDYGHKFENSVYESGSCAGSSLEVLRLKEYHRCLFLHLGIPMDINPALLLFFQGLVMSYRMKKDLKDRENIGVDMFARNSFTEFHETAKLCTFLQMRHFRIIIVASTIVASTSRVDIVSVEVLTDSTFDGEKTTLVLCYNGFGHFVNLVDVNVSSFYVHLSDHISYIYFICIYACMHPCLSKYFCWLRAIIASSVHKDNVVLLLYHFCT